MRSIREILERFSPHVRDDGLSDAEIAQSLERFGSNRLTPLPREPLWKKFLAKFDEPIIKILLAATLLKTVVDLFDYSSVLPGLIGIGLIAAVLVGLTLRRWKNLIPAALFGLAVALVAISVAIGEPSWEGLAVMVAVVLATGVAFLSEYKSDREFELLNAEKESLRVKSRRHGEVHQVPLEGIVVGDVVILEMGDEPPADGRLLKANELYIDQSLLTGESVPVHKRVRRDDETIEGPDIAGCVYRGTQVVDGAGEMVVTEVGDMTMIGQIARRLSAEAEEEEREGSEVDATNRSEERVKRKLTISKEQTPLQQKLTELARLISRIGYVAAVAIFMALLVRGILVGEVRLSPHAGETTGHALRGTVGHLLDYFVYMVIIIVVAVPEGLPMSVTISLALAMRKMTRANSLVRQLVACETIGSATVICSDKTGTLTQNQMRVDRLAWDGQTFERGAGAWPSATFEAVQSAPMTPIDWLTLIGMVNSTANLERKGGKTLVLGNTTEGAILQWAEEHGIQYGKVRDGLRLFDQLHFSSERKRMTSVVEINGALISLVKGAPEILIEHSTHYLTAEGSSRDLTLAMREVIQAQLQDASSHAMRTLAFGFRRLPADMPRDEDSLHERQAEVELGLTFVGFVAIRDPLRPDVKEAVDQCRNAGIEVKMITGDDLQTARAIGQEIGLLDRPDALALTSDQFNRMDDEELNKEMPRLRILARARPLDKQRIVRILQGQGHVVAMTGDGTNDAPALKKADVGLAMGIAGTEVAKEASKIVLLDDSFATIVKAVHWGRSLYENIQRFIQFQLTINVSALLIAFLGPFLGVRPPITVLQLLWINVIMDTFAAIALCSEPPRPGLMRDRPKRRDEDIITPAMRVTILSTALFFVVVMIGLLLGMEHGHWLAGSSGPNPPHWEFAPLNARQVTLFFTIYVLFQVWNQINCRSLTPDVSGLHRIFANPTFLTIASLVLVGQIVIVNFGGPVFAVEPLYVSDWILVALGTASVLLFAEVARRIRKRNTEGSPISQPGEL
jgi:Ca2+-transporting ATPase